MRDMISCEEVFGLDKNAVAAHGKDAWVADVTVANGFDDVEVEEEEEEVCWCKFFESCPSCFGKK